MSTAQQACNIAGYLAESFIQASIGAAVDNINSVANVVTFAGAFAGLFVSAGVFSGVLAAASRILYNDIVAGTLSDYATARSSATLKGELICAIQGAIASDGYVTAGNFSAVLTAITGIAYLPVAVVTTIHDFVQALGVDGVRQIQAVGAVAVYDCSACSGGWCFTWDFTAADGGFLADHGTYVAGVGWRSVVASGNTADFIYRNCSATSITSLEVTYTSPVALDVNHSVQILPGGGVTDFVPTPPSGTHTLSKSYSSSGITQFEFRLGYTGSASGTFVITKVTARGTGSNPFGTSNCV